VEGVAAGREISVRNLYTKFTDLVMSYVNTDE